MDGAPPTQQSCYRHPGREANVRCARCDRPVCPDCMISASVGFQCPECVHEGNRDVREPRTQFGGRLVSNTALVTKILIVANLAVFLLVQALGERLVDTMLLVGVALDTSGETIGVATGLDQWYRLLSAVFLHQQFTHIALNMLSLWWLGPSLEAALGRARFLALYLLAGLGGSAVSFLVGAYAVAGTSPHHGSLGASGAIFGLLGAVGVLVKRLGGDMRPIVIILVLNLVFTFTWSGIDWRAHLGGLVFGALIALGLVHAPRQNRTLVQALTCAAALVATVALVWIGSTHIQA